jgi:type IV pilus assembly protein PilM
MDNPFKTILNNGLSFFKSSESTPSVVGIDVGASSIKVVQLKKKGGKAVLETYGALSLGPYASLDVGQITNLPLDKITQAIIDVLRESNITAGSGAFSIPSSASLIFIVTLPSQVTEKDYPTIIPTEARKYIPVPISEVTLDWWVIPQMEEQFEGEEQGSENSVAKKEVLVAAIHNDAFAKYQNILKNLPVKSDTFEIEVFSSIRATFGHELSSILIVDLGASKTKVSIVEHGVMREFHTVNRGSADITTALSKSLGITFPQAEEMKRKWGLTGNPDDKSISEIVRISVDYIFSETNGIVLNYEKKYNRSINKVILTGGGALLRGIMDSAAANFRSEVAVGNPFSKVEAPAFLKPILDSTGPEFAVAVGLALRKLQ